MKMLLCILSCTLICGGLSGCKSEEPPPPPSYSQAYLNRSDQHRHGEDVDERTGVRLPDYDAEEFTLYPAQGQPSLAFRNWREVAEFTETNFGTAVLDYDKAQLSLSVIIHDPQVSGVVGPTINFTVDYRRKQVLSSNFLPYRGESVVLSQQRILEIAELLHTIIGKEATSASS